MSSSLVIEASGETDIISLRGFRASSLMGLDLLLLGISLGPVTDLLICWLPSERAGLSGVVTTLSLVANADLALLMVVRELLSLDLLCCLVVLLPFFPHSLAPALLALATHSSFSVLLVKAELTDLAFLVVVGFLRKMDFKGSALTLLLDVHDGDRETVTSLAFSSVRSDLDGGGAGNQEDARALLAPADLKLRLSV